MKCKAVHKEIEELVEGARLSAEADVHLVGCQACRGFADERASLRLLVGGLDKVTAPPDFDWRLRARLAEARSERESDRRNWLRSFTTGARAATATAACIMLLLAGVILYRQATLTPATAPPSNVTIATTIDGNERQESQAAAVAPQNSAPVKSSTGALASSRVGEGARVSAGKGPKAEGAKQESAAQSTGQRQRIYSTDYGSRGAEEFTGTGSLQNSYVAEGPVISVRVPDAPVPAQLRLEVGKGTRRTLSSVNFGGQESIERPEKARLVPVSEKGIW